mgnify:FL=1
MPTNWASFRGSFHPEPSVNYRVEKIARELKELVTVISSNLTNEQIDAIF